MISFKQLLRYVWLTTLVSLLVGCAHGPGSENTPRTFDAAGLERELQQAVEACRENARELAKTYDHLHNLAVDEAARSTSDIQLGYIQKTYLYVHQARLVADFQVRLLSDYPYVKKEHRSNFLTLRALDLDRAIYELEDSAGFIEVYTVFIKAPKVLAEAERARQLISGTIYLYEKLLEAIKPAVNPAAPFSRDPYALFPRGT